MPLEFPRQKRRQPVALGPPGGAVQPHSAEEPKGVDRGRAYWQISFVARQIPRHSQQHPIPVRGAEFVAQHSAVEIQDHHLDAIITPPSDEIVGMKIPMHQSSRERECRHPTGLGDRLTPQVRLCRHERRQRPRALDQGRDEPQPMEEQEVSPRQCGERLDDGNPGSTQRREDTQLALRSTPIEVAPRKQETEGATTAKVADHAPHTGCELDHRDASTTLRIRERNPFAPQGVERHAGNVATQHRPLPS